MSTISALKAHFPTIHHHCNMKLRDSKLNQPSAILTTWIMGKDNVVPSVRSISHYAQYFVFDDGMNTGTSLGAWAYVSQIRKHQVKPTANSKSVKMIKNFLLTTLFRHTWTANRAINSDLKFIQRYSTAEIMAHYNCNTAWILETLSAWVS
jgi:hypothetical protein